VWFPKKSIPTPWMVTGNSEGVGVSKIKIFNGKYAGNHRLFQVFAMDVNTTGLQVSLYFLYFFNSPRSKFIVSKHINAPSMVNIILDSNFKNYILDSMFPTSLCIMGKLKLVVSLSHKIYLQANVFQRLGRTCAMRVWRIRKENGVLQNYLRGPRCARAA